VESFKENILKTILYFDILNRPLNEKEIFENLPPSFRKIDENKLKKALFELKNEGILGNQGDLWFLPGRENLIFERKLREKISFELWKFVEKIAKILKFFPFIEAIFVSGSLPINNAHEFSDIDLFVITFPGRLFFARAFLNFFLKISFLKVSNKKTKRKFCPNLYFSLNKMTFLFPSYFSAFYFFHATPIIDFSNISKKFKKANSWLKNYFQFWEKEFKPPFGILSQKPKITLFFEKLFSKKIGNFFEKIFKKIQMKIYLKKYMNKKIPGRVILKDWMVEDHPYSKEKEILEIFDQKLLALKSKRLYFDRRNLKG